MFRIIYLISIFHLLPFLPVFSQNIDWLPDTNYDFGHVTYHTSEEGYFSFVNLSHYPVVIETIRTSCGCTATEWSKEPVPPGETSHIKVVFDAKSVGKFKKKIQVFFLNYKKPFVLYIEGEVLK